MAEDYEQGLPAGNGADGLSVVSRWTVIVDGIRRALEPDQSFVIGRGDDADLIVESPLVSRRHVVLEPAGETCVLQNVGRNGTFLNGQRVTEVRASEVTTFVLGAPRHGVPVVLVPPGDAADTDQTCRQQGQLPGVHRLTKPRIRIGRLPNNDVVLDDLLVSRHHAELYSLPDGWKIRDRNSSNGTFVGGRRVSTADVAPDDVIAIGRSLLQVRDDRLVVREDVGPIRFCAHDVTVTRGGKTVVHRASFSLPGGAMLAVIGPSGSGKSTLLAALAGTRPATSGEVRYAGRDLYTDYEELRHRIALVPQDDILHARLTVGETLAYAARLRFPDDISSSQRLGRVDEVLAGLGLEGETGKRVGKLSGGQRKRTSVALELLTKPSVLLLDEPTSGLDPGADRSIMQRLRRLTAEGPTVIVTTHNPAALEVCDRVLVLTTEGRVAYFGPPSELLAYFAQVDLHSLFHVLGQGDGEDWELRFRRSPLREQYLGTGSGPPPPTLTPRTCPGPTSRGRPLSQVPALCHRYLALILADRPYTTFLALVPLVLSLLLRAVPGGAGLSAAAARVSGDAQPIQLLLVLIIGATLMGAAVSIREIVKERDVYLRERAVGLLISAYLASKILVLGTLASLQATAFTALGLVGRNAPDDPLVVRGGHLEILLAVVTVTFTSMLTGLLISALIENSDRGLVILVLVVMAQLICCGGLFPVHDRPVLEQVAWLTPARWAFALAASSTGLTTLRSGTADPLWVHTPTVWWADLLVLGGIAVGLVATITYFLGRLDPHRKRVRLGRGRS